MDYIIVVFRSREQTLKLSSYLKNRGVPCAVINTPKEANVGCGLSLKIPPNALNSVKFVLSSVRVSSFIAFFAVTERGGKRVLSSIK